MRHVIAALLLLGCSSGSDVTASADIVVVTAENHANQGFTETVTAHLRNDGGPGTYTIEAWGSSGQAGGGNTLYGRTEAVGVAADYDETTSWQFQTGASSAGNEKIHWLLVFSRDPGTAACRQTSRFDLP